jgi:serine/threonine protein kinase
MKPAARAGRRKCVPSAVLLRHRVVLTSIDALLDLPSLHGCIKAERAGAAPPWWTPTQRYIALFGVASFLEFAHWRGCAHGDLTPKGVFLDERFEPCIPRARPPRAPPKFRAPELLWGAPPDAAADVYSFGRLLFFVLTKSDPYHSWTDREIERAVMDGNLPEIPDFVDRGYAELIRRCCDADRESRPDFRSIVAQLSESDFRNGLDLDRIAEYQARLRTPGMPLVARRRSLSRSTLGIPKSWGAAALFGTSGRKRLTRGW